MRLRRTAALAGVASAAFLVFLGYAIVIGHDNRMTPGDDLFHTLARDLYSRVAEYVAEVVTALGSLTVAGGVVLTTGFLLARRGRGRDAAVLLAGFALIVVAVHVAKGVVGRPRPPDRLTGTTGHAYPSGHAAYSTVYAAVALAVVSVRDALPRCRALIAAGVAVAAVVGVTRVYLRVHWWSDVLGGWALGIAIFAALAVVSLAVDAVRHN